MQVRGDKALQRLLLLRLAARAGGSTAAPGWHCAWLGGLHGRGAPARRRPALNASAASAWEVFLRAIGRCSCAARCCPGRRRPEGYMEHEQELARLRARGNKVIPLVCNR